MPKYEMHLHTAEGDKVVKEGAAEIVRLYHDAGFDGIVVTNHYFSMFFDWFADELAGASHSQIIDRWLKGYRVARDEGQKLGMDILLGAEVRFDGSPNDYLLYGVDEDFFYHAPLLNRLNNVHELIRLLPEDVCVVHAHPFRDRMVVADPTPVWGIEVYNGVNDSYRNQMARDFARHYGKGMTSGSDFHYSGACGRGGILTERRITTPKELSEVLRSGSYTLIET